MIDREAFTSIPNSFERGGKSYPVITTGGNQLVKCGVLGHLVPSCPEKKAYGVPPKFDLPRDETTCSAELVVGLSTASTDGQKAPVPHYLPKRR